MKALSIRQPWAWLIVNGFKNIENRTWQAKMRGPILIHAGRDVDLDCFGPDGKILNAVYWSPEAEAGDITHNLINGVIGNMPTHRDDFELGGIVGLATITGCVRSSRSPWFTGDFGFVLENPQTLPFTPFRGMLNFFEVPDELVQDILLSKQQ